MMLSKHHYAVELARRGNDVCFLNPPNPGLEGRVSVAKSGLSERLTVVSYRPRFPTSLRFHLRRLFDLAMILEVHSLLKQLGKRFEVVWCFEPNLYSNLRRFRAGLNMFHLADNITQSYQANVAKSADLVLAVAGNLLGVLKQIPVPKFVINHGVSAEFVVAGARASRQQNPLAADRAVRVGYVGNLLSSALDRELIMTLVKNHAEVGFNFWGSYSAGESNVGGNETKTASDFVAFLQQRRNVTLHGVLRPSELAVRIQDMDAFLLCYDSARDVNRGSNSHKLLEYLSTGKVVISTQISSYRGHRDIIQMVDHDSDGLLPELFAATLSDLKRFNAPQIQQKRRALAHDNSYARQIERIEAIVSRLPLREPMLAASPSLMS
jgi:hypothetical protein